MRSLREVNDDLLKSWIEVRNKLLSKSLFKIAVKALPITDILYKVSCQQLYALAGGFVL